jgi:hypothetical protein
MELYNEVSLLVSLKKKKSGRYRGKDRNKYRGTKEGREKGNQRNSDIAQCPA